MKTKIILFCLALLLISACNTQKDIEPAEKTDEVEYTQTYVDDSWCSEGTTVNTNSGNTNANIEVIGIETSGEYAGYCHTHYVIESEGYNVETDYYLDQEGNGYSVSNVNGQIFTTEVKV